MHELTPRQREVFDAVNALSAAGRGPTLDELGNAIGLASSFAVRRHLQILERKGYLRPRRYRRHRDIAPMENQAA